MNQIVMYTTAMCPYCINAKRLLDSKGVTYKEIRVDREPQLRQKMMAESGERTVPQIWIGDRHIGGFTELWALDKRGELDPLLSPNK